MLSTGTDELLASSIITPSVTAGELIFGLVEVVSATNITTSMATAQIYAGLDEILEATADIVCDVNTTEDGIGIIISLSHSLEISTKGGIFKTTFPY